MRLGGYELKFGRSKQPPVSATDVENLAPFAALGLTNPGGWASALLDGDKFDGGFGITKLYQIDYWTLRQRSAQIFDENLYGRGLIRRLITNEINTGLTPEASPDELIIGLKEDSLSDWTENVENRFAIWSKNPRLCDYYQVDTFAAIQRNIRREALVGGDVLVVLRHAPGVKLPAVQVLKGEVVQTPLDQKPRDGHTIEHGVEFDSKRRKVAFWIRQKDGSGKRLPAFGEKSGRRIAWLVYGTDKRLDEVRGQPLLTILLQSLREIDRYRDSAQRKAVINSIMAMFIETDGGLGSLPMTGGATRKGTGETKGVGARTYNIAEQIPGLVVERGAKGEKPVFHGGNGTDINFGIFEEAVIQTVAWACEMPPSILRMAFSSNYSAGQAEINEFKIYLNLRWSIEGETVGSPIYTEWLISETLINKISAPGLLEAWRDSSRYDIFGAWVAADWYGSIKPSTDMYKQGKGSQILVKEGWSNNALESRKNTGTKFSKNIKRLRRENEMKAEANEPLVKLLERTRAAGGDVSAMAQRLEHTEYQQDNIGEQ